MVVNSLIETENSQAVMDATKESATLGRMTIPRRLEQTDLETYSVCRRIDVLEFREYEIDEAAGKDGWRLRFVDHFSENNVNKSTGASNGPSNDTIDTMQSMVFFAMAFQIEFEMWKADISKAYPTRVRRVHGCALQAHGGNHDLHTPKYAHGRELSCSSFPQGSKPPQEDHDHHVQSSMRKVCG